MEPENTNLNQNSADPAYGGNLESEVPVTAVFQPPGPNIPQSLFRYNRRAFLLTSATVAAIILIAVASLLLNGSQSGKKSSQSAGPQANNYAVASLPLGGVKVADKLQLGEADKLVINGQLRVSNSLVLTPQTEPANPTAGQIYFDQTAKVPYYYNGSQFVGLATDQSLAAIAAKSGVINVQGTASQVNVTNVNGVVTLSLPQAIATDSGVAFGQLTLAGGPTMALRVSGDSNITGNLGVGGVITGNGAGLSNVNAAQLNGQSGSYYTNAANIASGTLSDARLSTNVTLQGNNFNGNSQLVKLDSNGAAGSTGLCLLSTVGGGAAFQSCPAGGNISSGA